MQGQEPYIMHLVTSALRIMQLVSPDPKMVKDASGQWIRIMQQMPLGRRAEMVRRSHKGPHQSVLNRSLSAKPHFLTVPVDSSDWPLSLLSEWKAERRLMAVPGHIQNMATAQSFSLSNLHPLTRSNVVIGQSSIFLIWLSTCYFQTWHVSIYLQNLMKRMPCNLLFLSLNIYRQFSCWGNLSPVGTAST